MGWLATPERFLRPSRVRLGFLSVAALAFFVTEFGRFVYRPYVRRNDINDFGLADSIGEYWGIVVQIFVIIAAYNSTKKQSFRIVSLSSRLRVYEFLQPVLPKGSLTGRMCTARCSGWAYRRNSMDHMAHIPGASKRTRPQ